MADLFDYIFQFPDRATALADSVVGAFFNSPPQGTPMEVLIYKNTLINSVNPESGYWFIIETVGPNNTLATHPNVQIINDRTLQLAGKPSAAASFDVSHTNIVFNSFGNYCANGLVLIG